MQTVLIVIHLLVVIALVGAVLLQRSEGGVLGTGGGGGFMTGRGQANALSRATAILGTLYFVTALTMSILASWGRAPHSLINNVPTSTSTTGAPAGAPTTSPASLLDQLKQMQNQGGGPPAAPAAPAAPAQDAPK
jgi:preprotein translocase subunit SecG